MSVQYDTETTRKTPREVVRMKRGWNMNPLGELALKFQFERGRVRRIRGSFRRRSSTMADLPRADTQGVSGFSGASRPPTIARADSVAGQPPLTSAPGEASGVFWCPDAPLATKFRRFWLVYLNHFNNLPRVQLVQSPDG